MARKQAANKRQHSARSRIQPRARLALGHDGRHSGFGLQPSSLGGAHMYQSGGNGSINTKHELGLQVVDYFDYQSAEAGTGNVPQYVSNYFWNTDQNLINTDPLAPGGQDVTFCRVRKVWVYVMPQVSDRPVTSGSGRSNADSMLTVNCQVPAYSALGAFGTKAFATNVQVSNILPTINPRWKKVLTCDLQKTFQSGVMLPVFTGINQTTSDQCLFQMSIVDPTTGEPYQTGNSDSPDAGIRVKVVMSVDQPIASVAAASFTVFRNEEFSTPFLPQNGSAYPGTTLQYAQIDLKKTLDNMS
jgi:hypothetical protein